MEKGHATPDDLVFSTGLPRAKVKSALKKLAKHNVCIIDKIGLQQAHEDRVSYSVDMNGALARPCKAVFVTFMRNTCGEKASAQMSL